MLGRYNAGGLGTLTLRQKGEVVRWGGFTVAGLALLAIPVIFAWPAITLWRKYGWAARFAKRRVDIYRKARRETSSFPKAK